MIDALVPKADLSRREPGTPLDTEQRSGINGARQPDLYDRARAWMRA